MSTFVQEFKTFAMKGNVMELAVAVVIGAAFGKIVSSLVNNIITPLLGLFMGGINFSGLSYTVRNAEVTYGVFIQSVIDFVIIALVIFLVVKGINHAKELSRTEVVPEPEPPKAPPEEITLLREIRDALRK